MPKENPKPGKQKGRRHSILASSQVGRLLKNRHLRQLDQRSHGDDSNSEYATEQVEGSVRGTVNELANTVLRKQPKERRKPGAQPPIAPAEDRHYAEHDLIPEPSSNVLQGRRLTNHIPQSTGEKNVQAPVSSPPSTRSGRGRHGSAPSRFPSTSSYATGTRPVDTSTGRATIPRHCPAQIKERTRAAASTVKTRANIRAGAKGKLPIPKLRPARSLSPARQTTRKARQAAQRHMKQRMVAQARQAAKTTAVAVRRVIGVVLKATVALARSLMGLFGGVALIAALVLVILIAAVSSSPFGLFFAAEKNAPDTVSVAEAVAMVNMVYNTKLEELQAGGYDSIVVHGQVPDWPDVLAVFAVKLAGADTEGMDVATLDTDRLERLTAVFWDMTTIASYVEEIDHPGDDEDDPGWTECILHITVTAKTADDMRAAYGFTVYQNSALDELLADRSALSSLAGDLTITKADLADILKNLPTDLSPERRAVVETALQLVGKVNYFWGGKSYVIGWDSQWGTLQKVWAPGNSTSGTYRPYGLDCTGFVDWVYRNAGVHSDGHWYIGQNLTGISLEHALPGDIALFPDASHVGLIVGKTPDGSILVCHCSYSQNNVVVTEFASTGFTAIGRPNVFN